MRLISNWALLLLFSVCFVFAQSNTLDRPLIVKSGFALAEKKYKKMLANVKSMSEYPRTTSPDGTLKSVDIKDWTGGFWPGNLWLVYDYTKSNQWKKEAEKWTETLNANQYNTTNHDLGFMMYCSYGNGYRLTGNKLYKDVLIQSAKSLSQRFNTRIGCIKSWESKMSWDGKTLWKFPVIIDNMMNLELLFFASKVTGDSTYKNIAVKHAETTMKNHLRSDFSCYHVVNYDTITGKVLNKQTAQGFSDNSTWSRGQAWGIYGFTMVYRETGDIRFLTTARKMADFYLNNQNLPKDKIPFWDFNVNQQGYTPQWKYDSKKFKETPRDASAAAITCSALFELSKYLGKQGKPYMASAVEILKSLSSDRYLATQTNNNNFLLMHSVGSIPNGIEIDVPLVYADYYYMEALLRYNKIIHSIN